MLHNTVRIFPHPCTASSSKRLTMRGDGGLYAELVQTAFEDTSVPEGYRVKDGKLYPPANSCNHLTCAKPHPDMCYRWPTEEIPAWSLTQLEGEGASMKLTTEYPAQQRYSHGAQSHASR